jgi:hypothetical protein
MDNPETHTTLDTQDTGQRQQVNVRDNRRGTYKLLVSSSLSLTLTYCLYTVSCVFNVVCVFGLSIIGFLFGYL